MKLPPCDHDECGPTGCTKGSDTAAKVKELYQNLSNAEVPVLKLHVGGLSAKEIGGKLFISPKTVAVHMHSIRRKMQRLGLCFAPLIVSQKQTPV